MKFTPTTSAIGAGGSLAPSVSRRVPPPAPVEADIIHSEDGIVFLRVVEPVSSVMAKKLRRRSDGRWEVFGDYGRSKRVRAVERPVRDLASLANALREVAENQKVCAIRGGIRAGFEEAVTAPKGVRRLLHDRPEEQETAAFEERARCWVACDLDSFTLPEFVDPIADVEHVIDAAVEQLPPEFYDTSCFWQLTSSHGIKPGGRVRLWFWLSRPTSNRELKAWLNAAKVDHAVFAAVQPIYTASPSIPSGVPDLLPVRVGERMGDRDWVEVPAPEDLAAVERVFSGGNSDRLSVKSDEEALQLMGDPPAYPDGRGFFAPVKAAIAAAVADNGIYVDADALLARIDAQLVERGHTRSASYIAFRKKDARTLVEWYIRRAEEREGVAAMPPPSAGVLPPDPETRLAVFAEALQAQAAAYEDRYLRGKLLRGVAPVAVPKAVSVEVANTAARNHIHHHLWDAVLWALGGEYADDLRAAGLEPRAKPRNLVLCAGAGVGKTTSFIDVLKDIYRRLPPHIPLQIAVLDTDHTKAARTVRDLEAAGVLVPIIHLRGRRQQSPDGIPLCHRADLPGRAYELGLSVKRTLCQRRGTEPCPFHPTGADQETCGYFRQTENLPRRCILVATHHAVGTGVMSGGVELPRIVIVDEDAARAIRRKPIHSTFDGLRKYVERAGAQWGDRLEAVHAILDVLALPPADLVGWQNQLEGRGVTLGRLTEAAEFIKDKWWKAVGDPADEASITSGLSWIEKDRASLVLISLLEGLVLDWQRPDVAPQSVRIETWRLDGAEQTGPEVTPATPCEAIEDRVFLALDASAKPETARALYGADARFEEIAARRHMKVVQIVAPSFSKKALGLGQHVSDDERERGAKLIRDLERAVDLLVRRHGAGKLGVIVPLDLRKLWTGDKKLTGFTEWRGALVGHFGALRGLNDIEHCTAMLVVGCQQPMRTDVERIARADFARDPDPLRDLAIWQPGTQPPDFPWIYRGFLMRDGRRLGMKVRYHPDPRVDAELRQIRDEEVIQAFDRVRAVWAAAGAEKTVYLAAPVVLPITVELGVAVR